MLPMTREEMAKCGWRELDVLLVTGDAYFDHPSHGAAVIGRVLEAAGYRVGIVARPSWRDTADFTRLGRPRLWAGATAGAVDSLLNNKTAELRPRRDDAYAPGGRAGGRPDFATLVYANRLREAFPGLPIVLGGIEASLRRFAYFDPQSRKARRSVLVDSRADVLVFGPGEQQAEEISHRLASGQGLEDIKGTARLVRGPFTEPEGAVELPPFGEIVSNFSRLVDQSLAAESAGRPYSSLAVYQRYDEGTVLALPREPETTDSLDAIFALPFARIAHPSYKEPIPALEMIRWSVISHRGCPGGCSFCGLAMHQGRRVVSRSQGSIADEARELASFAGFKGALSDVGGPTANAFGLRYRHVERCRSCRRPSCLFPQLCSNLVHGQRELLDLLESLKAQRGLQRVWIASGVRHDLALAEPKLIEALARSHTSGHLKVAPEHVAKLVLRLMRKPPIEQFEAFEAIFRRASTKASKEQYLVPYFIAGFPGCTPASADLAASWLARRGQRLQQSQTFIPIPQTLAAAMYAAGVDADGSPLFVADARERRRQKLLLVQ